MTDPNQPYDPTGYAGGPQGSGNSWDSGGNAGWAGNQPTQNVPYQQGAGYQPYPQQPGAPAYYGAPTQQRTNPMGTAGFVLGLLGLLLFWIPVFGMIMALLGVIFGSVGIMRHRRDNSGSGLAIAGLVLGILGLILAVIVLVAVLAVP